MVPRWLGLLLSLASLIVLPGRTSAAPATVAPADASLFAYDREAPFNVRELGQHEHDGVRVRDISFVGVDKPIEATIVSPTGNASSLAAILYVHWLGRPATSNRAEFLNEAVALAGQGVVSLLVDTMWSQPLWYRHRVPEEDHARSVRQVIELRRAIDLLLAQPGVDASRVALVGHDFGAMYGIVAGALDGRAKTYVLMAGAPHFADWLLFAQQPKDPAAYRAQLAPLDPVRFVPQLAPASVFFQFAANDEYVSAEAAAVLYAAARPRKHAATYDAGHDLQKPEVAADRIAWLMRELVAR